jgi:hypothetical protein
MRFKMGIAYTRVHNTHYLAYIDGKQRAEIDNDDGDWWTVTFDGERNKNIKYKDLREAKKAIENMVLREYTDDVGC